MVYAGNGKLLAAFVRKSDMDKFLAKHCSWSREMAKDAHTYPQYRRALFSISIDGVTEAINDKFETDYFWTEQIAEAIAQ